MSGDHESQPEEWIEELLEELRDEEVDAWFRQVEREVPLPVVLGHLGDPAAVPAISETTRGGDHHGSQN